MYGRNRFRGGFNNRGFFPLGLGFATGLAAGSLIRPNYYYYRPIPPYYPPYPYYF